MVIAVPTLVRIVVTPIVTHQADRRRALKATLAIGSIVGLLGMTAVGLVSGPLAILVAFAVAMAALSPMLSLSDAYALSGLGARGRNYGPVRLWGSVAFIGGNVGAGLAAGSDRAGPSDLADRVRARARRRGGAGAGAARHRRRAGAGGATRSRRRVLLRNPAFVAMVLASSMVQGSHALYYGFSTVQWRGEGFTAR